VHSWPAVAKSPDGCDRMTGLMFHLIPHTHWDREWYLPHTAFQARLVPVLDDLLSRLARDPAYRSFLLDGQTVLIEDYLQVRPERAGEIRALARQERLALGPWYVLADELIPSGEALVRNLLLGATDAARYAEGHRVDVLYSPDAFGHPARWPLLAREFGIKYGVLWRGLAGPGDLYRWDNVLVWHLPPSGYEIGAALPADRERLRDAWGPVREQLTRRARAAHVALFVGADHHAAHPEVGMLRDLLAELDPANGFRVSRLEEFFQALETSAPRAAVLHGELRAPAREGGTWSLQGVHGTRAPEKRANSDLELWLERFAEPLAALARRRGGRDRQPLLDFAWRALVRCQFHDTLAGTVSDLVADAVHARHREIAALAREIVRGALHDLVGHDPDAARERGSGGENTPALVVWNPAARERGGVVIADLTFFLRDVFVGPPSGRLPRERDEYRPFALGATDRPSVPVQILERAEGFERIEAERHYPDQDRVTRVRVAFRMSPPVAGLGFNVLRLRDPMPLDRDPDDAVRVRARTLANHRVSVQLAGNGSLTVRDLQSGERFDGLLALESEPDSGDAYTFSRGRGLRSKQGFGSSRTVVRTIATGPLVGALEARFTLPAGLAASASADGAVGVRLHVWLHAASPLVRVVLDVDNRGLYHRLRARLPTGLTNVSITAGGPFGSVARASGTADARSNHGLFEAPARTAPAHRFAAAARDSRGLALLAPGFFEYEWTPNGDLLFTVLRAIGQLSRPDLPERPGHAAWPTEIPGAQCLGPTRVELALACVTSADIERGDVLPALWEDGFVPLHGYWLREAGELLNETPNITLEGPGLVLSAVKPAQAGSPMILRCYNATDQKVAGAWRFGTGMRSVHRVRADERESAPLALESRGHLVRFAADPHEVVSLLVT